MADRFSNKLADNRMLAMSSLFVAPDDGTYDIIRIPHWTFITGIWLEVTSVYTLGTGGADLTIGWKGNKETADPDGLMSNAVAAITELGIKKAQGKYFDAGSGAVTVTSTLTGNAEAGNFRIFCEYTVIQ